MFVLRNIQVNNQSFADIDECTSDHCQNGGTCIDQVTGYICQCALGYTDLQCHTGECLRVCFCVSFACFFVSFLPFFFLS